MTTFAPVKNDIRVHLALLVVSTIYAATFTLAKEVMPVYIQAASFVMVRIVSAATLFFLFHRLLIRERVAERKDYLKLFVGSVFGVVANMLLFFEGLSRTEPIHASVLMVNTPVFVLLLAVLFKTEQLKGIKVLGVLVAAVGATLLLGGADFSFSADTIKGDLLVTANAISYAFYLVWIKPLTTKYNALTVTAWTFLFGAVLVTPFGYSGLGEVQWHTIPTYGWSIIIFVVLGTTFITYLLNAWALKKATPTLVGSYIYLQPVLATLIAVSLNKDVLTWEKALFALLIFVGVYLVSKRSFYAKKNN